VAQFATAAELGDRLGLTLTNAEITRANALLTLASGLIQDGTKQTISLVTGEVFTRKGDYPNRIRLPQRPVVSVASVTLDGVALVAGTDFYLDGDELVRMNALPQASFGLPNSGWGYPWKDIVVTYTHGYATIAIPTLVKTVCMEMVTRVWVNPGSVIQEAVAGTQVTYAPYSAPPRGLLLTKAEKAELNELLRRRAGSIGLR
jgi:hypothetical protein